MPTKHDLRADPAYAEVRDYAAQVYGEGTQQPICASGLSVTADGTKAATTAWRFDRLEGKGSPKVAVVDLATAQISYPLEDDGDNRLPKWAPDGASLAWLAKDGDHLNLVVAAADALARPKAVAGIEDVVEAFTWAGDSRRILVQTAGSGADLAGYQGATTVPEDGDTRPSWSPTVETPDRQNRLRRLWICEQGVLQPIRVSGELNVWEAGWAGPDAIIAIVSREPGETDWYGAYLVRIELAGHAAQPLYRSSVQLGQPTASPSGASIAVIEAVASDRGLIAGDVIVIDAAHGTIRRPVLDGIAVTALSWRDERRLAFAGLRDFDMIVGEIDLETGSHTVDWASQELTSGDPYPALSLFGASGIALLVDGYRTPSTLLVLDKGTVREVATFAPPAQAALLERSGQIEPVRWQAPDGLEIHGWLVTPQRGKGPFPMVTMIHGGPVFCHRGRWLSNPYYGDIQFLVRKGYALFLPNPRGSGGRGNAFAAMVRGDMGGAECADLFSGIDALIARGVADPARLGVMGASHGGFMTAWLVTQVNRFAAAISIAPVVNWHSQHWTSNIPKFDELFLDDDPRRPNGNYFHRSPVMHAHKARTPTLVVAGMLDRCTPPGQAVEFYNALGDGQAERALLLYPEEGHRVQHLPARIDYITRVHQWFDRWMPILP